MKYKDQVVIITGAGKGIGNALAIAYAHEGATIILMDIDLEALEETQGEIKKAGNKSIYYEVDLTKVTEVEKIFKRIRDTFKKINILINNAGIGITKPIFEMLVEDWDEVINTNLRGTFVCSIESARIMKENGGGSIVNIASTRALMSEPDTIPYSASKGGILSLTHSLAVSLGRYHIRVNSISPGWIETGDYSQLSKSDHAQHPAGRVGRPQDIVKACLYLTDPENDFVTGTNIVVDGGMTVKMMYE